MSDQLSSLINLNSNSNMPNQSFPLTYNIQINKIDYEKHIDDTTKSQSSETIVSKDNSELFNNKK